MGGFGCGLGSSAPKMEEERVTRTLLLPPLVDVLRERTEPFGVAVPFDLSVEDDVTFDNDELVVLVLDETDMRCFFTFFERTFSSSSLDG